MKTHKIYGHHLKGSVEKQNWYIGKTVRKLEYRWNNGNGYKTQPKFYNAIKKYGWDAFDHVFIAECETEEQAILAEAIFKKMYDSVDNGYNCFYEEDKGPWLNKNLTNEHKNKISKSLIGNDRAKGNKGKPHSKEHNKKVSEALTGKKLSEEHKKKLSEAHMGIFKNKTWKLTDGKRVWLDKDKI